MLENVGLHPWIPVVNSLRMLAELYEIDLSEKQLREVLEVVRLETEAAHQLYGRLSYGQKRKAELAAALVTEPDVLILDDPFMGIDPVARLELVGALRQMKEGRTLLYTTHLLDIATRFSDRIFIILNGQIQVMGTVQELIRQYGGKWRVRVASPLEGELPGFERCGSRQYTAETESMTELLGLFQTLAKLPIEELYVDPPTLQGVFETLVREKNP